MSIPLLEGHHSNDKVKTVDGDIGEMASEQVEVDV